jgi:hypothetical protein
VKRAIFLATVAPLAMLILAPMALAQGDTVIDGTTVAPRPGPSVSMIAAGGSGSPAPNIPPSGGPAILLPAASVLLGSGILTYAVLRRR